MRTPADGILYTLCELTSQLAVHRFPQLPAPPLPICVLSTFVIPPKPSEDIPPAAELIIAPASPSFDTTYLYASNRNNPSPLGDTIAIFSLADPEQPKLVNEVHTGLKHVRGIELGGLEGRWLIAGGVQGGGVKVFERTDGGRGLTEVVHNARVQKPTGFLWM